MPPKPQAPPPSQVQPPDWPSTGDLGATPRSEQEEYPLVWVYGVNDHLDAPTAVPGDLELTGMVSADFRRFCQALGAFPHPAFKERKGPEKPVVRSRRPSLLNPAPTSEEPEAPKEPPVLSVRSILLDSMTMHILSLLLPFAHCLKVLCFSDCRLDCQMLGLLRDGLSGDCSVESLQLEWNPVELPLPATGEEDPTHDGESRRDSHVSGAAGEGTRSPGGGSRGTVDDLEHKERLRYLAQSHRFLRCFRETLEARFSGLENAWSRLMGNGADADALLSAGDFHDVLEARLGISGAQVAEVFEVLDGPDYAAGQGKISLKELCEAVEAQPEADEEQDLQDPIGLALAPFLDADCILESVSFRACAIGRLELGPISATLTKCPWQLRCLNLWDNRVDDRGAAILGAALMPYRGLEYLGLGKNRLTQAGMIRITKPFQTEVLDEAAYQEILAKRTQQESAKPKAEPKGKAKAKAKPEARRDSQSSSRRASALKGGRLKREAPKVEEEIEEVPSEPPTYIIRRPCELRTLTLSDNPISGAEAVEAIQPHGPRGAELVLRGTAAAAQLIAKRPELASKPSRQPLGLAANMPGSGLPAQPVGDGWVLRVA